MASILGMAGKAAGGVIKGTAKKGINAAVKAADFIGDAHSKAVLNVGRHFKNITEGSEGTIKKAINEAASETVEKQQTKNLIKKGINNIGDSSAEGWADIKDADLKQWSKDLNTGSGKNKADRIDRINEKLQGASGAVGEVAENATEGGSLSLKKIGGGKNALIGGALGALGGAGVGGIVGTATGADEDNMKSMVFMGALAGGAGGAVVGGLSKAIKGGASIGAKAASEAVETAADIASGEANHAVRDGAKGLLNKAGASLDDIGSNIAKKASKSGRLEVAKEIHKLTGGTAKEALDIVNDLASNPETLRNMDQSDALVKTMKKANAIGGAAQGAIMGSAGGAIIGGIGGAADEDDTFIGGALKGAFAGGFVGATGGGILGYTKGSPRVLASTTSGIKSLLGKE